MLWSKSDFFKQDSKVLSEKYSQVIDLLKFKGFEVAYTLDFLEAYQYFLNHPSKFDGATLVKDLEDIKDLDLAAMRHDFNYITQLPNYSGKSWLKAKIVYDWQYAKDYERLGKGIFTPYTRSIGLIISTPIYWLYKTIKNN